MGGGLLQLSAYGSQNEYLNGNPQMTFFRIVYKRLTNFSMESIKQSMEGPNELDVNNKIKLQCKIPRNADLISKVYFTFNLPDIYSGYNPDSGLCYKFQWIKNIGTNIVEHAEIIIGGQLIDRQYGEWLNVWSELNVSDSKKDSYNYLIGNTSDMYDPENYPGNNGVYPTSTLDDSLTEDPEYGGIDYLMINNTYERCASIRGRRIYVPLRFWFCQNSGLALPLIALQYHEIYINLELKPVSSLYTIIDTNSDSVNYGLRIQPNSLNENEAINSFLLPGSVDDLYSNLTNNTNNTYSGWGLDPSLEINYIFLDAPERKKFAKVTHEFLITQVTRNQFMGVVGSKSLDLILQHPVKNLIWTTKRNDMESFNIYNNYTNWFDEDIDPHTMAWVNQIYNINNQAGLDDEIVKNKIPSKSTAKYFYKNILKNAKLLFDGKDRISTKDNIYFNYLEPYNTALISPKEGIYCYSFELDNYKFQPSGSCNMSRIKKVTLEIETNMTEKKFSLNENLQYQYLFDINVYAINYNILRVMAGMGGLSFSS